MHLALLPWHHAITEAARRTFAADGEDQLTSLTSEQRPQSTGRRRSLRYNPTVDVRTLSALPGAELVIKGLEDLAHTPYSTEALLVLIGAPKLRSLGLAVPAAEGLPSPEHRLYAHLSALDSNTAHSRYNALVRRLVSFERAVVCASR